jgi:hypothetical protein
MAATSNLLLSLSVVDRGHFRLEGFLVDRNRYGQAFPLLARNVPPPLAVFELLVSGGAALF